MIDEGISQTSKAAIKKMDDEIFAKIAVFGAKKEEEKEEAKEEPAKGEEAEEEERLKEEDTKKQEDEENPERELAEKKKEMLHAQTSIAQSTLYRQSIPIDEYLMFFTFY
jgi:hypothetical protein